MSIVAKELTKWSPIGKNRKNTLVTVTDFSAQDAPT